MMKSFDIVERSLLCDRLQGSCSIPFFVDEDDLSYYQSIFQCYLNNRKDFNVRYDRDKSQYYIEVPEEIYISRFPFFSHARLRINVPFTITAEFNFIRYLRHFALYSECDENGFPVASENYDLDYDLSIRVADDNYIDSKVWKTYDPALIKDLSVCIPDLFKQLSDFIISEYVEGFSHIYSVLTVKQIEFNQDYFVGSHKSAEVLHQLLYFLISASGVEWIHHLSGIAVSVYKAEESSSELRSYGDLYCPTLKFRVGKGVFFKIYCKTSDHIRFEVTFQKQYIKHKFGKQGYADVYDPLRDIAKSFFRTADFKSVVLSAIDNSYSDNFSLYDNIVCFLDEVDPALSGVVNSVIYGSPIVDSQLIHYIHSSKTLRGLFVTKYVSNGSKVLVYNPALARQKRLEHRKQLVESDEKRQYMHRLWRDLKILSPDSDIFVMNGLNGFNWRKKC